MNIFDLDFKAAIFDLDGTLLDSLGVWNKIDKDFLGKRGFKVPDDYVKRISSLSFIQTAEYTIKYFNLHEKTEDVIKEWNCMAVNEYAYNVKLKPHAKEFLIYLKECGKKICTATNLPPVLSEPVLKNNGILELFDAFCHTGEVTRAKEFPDLFCLAAGKMNVNNKECIVFEYLPSGLQGAKSAGMLTCCVYDKHSDCHFCENKKLADMYIYSFEELLQFTRP